MQCDFFTFERKSYSAKEIKQIQKLMSNIHLLLIDVPFSLAEQQQWPGNWHYVPYKTNLHYVPRGNKVHVAISQAPEYARQDDKIRVRSSLFSFMLHLRQPARLSKGAAQALPLVVYCCTDPSVVLSIQLSGHTASH